MFKNRLGGDDGIPCPKGYMSWVDYFMVSQTPPKPFRSWPEVRAYYTAERVVDVEYEPARYPYTIKQDSNYIPDLVFEDQGVTYWCEVKGRFRMMSEAKKYTFIRDKYPDVVLLFVLEKPNIALPGATIRKTCGTRRTMEEWLDKEGFEYTYIDKLEEWLNADTN